MPSSLAEDFRRYCEANPRPCPLLEAVEPGSAEPALTARYPLAHGAPLHVGNPAGLGIGDLARPDYGEPWLPRDGEVPVFWACGVTPQAAAATSELELVITHSPGHMFVTDLRAEELRDVTAEEWDPDTARGGRRSPEA